MLGPLCGKLSALEYNKSKQRQRLCETQTSLKTWKFDLRLASMEVYSVYLPNRKRLSGMELQAASGKCDLIMITSAELSQGGGVCSKYVSG